MAVLNIIGGFGFLGYVLPYVLYPRDENETKNLIMPRMCKPGSSDFYIFVFRQQLVLILFCMDCEISKRNNRDAS